MGVGVGRPTGASSSSFALSAVSRGIPKAETGVLSLWEGAPEADGRGVRIAVLDTGCDLAAAGLGGEAAGGGPKYLDFLDCTGDGDVECGAPVSVPSSRTVRGATGRDLALGPWAPSEVRLGAVRLYDLVPRSVRARLQRERGEIFEGEHRLLLARTQQDLDDLQAEISACKAGDGDGDDGEEEEVEERKKGLILRRKDTETLLGQFQALLEGYEDAGPYMDVVLFQDEEGGGYKAVIDLQADGNLTEAVPMAPFGTSRQTGELGFGSAVTFCVQIYDGGKTLSIVTDAGSHGTHVAGIAAAHFGANSTKDGVAPGAQVLACKIGDGRLGSAETGTGLVRALIAAKKYGCDLINLSYGEPSWQMDSGRVAEVFADATHKWGMTVFTSAGNDGPALSSLGSPGALSSPHHRRSLRVHRHDGRSVLHPPSPGGRGRFLRAPGCLVLFFFPRTYTGRRHAGSVRPRRSHRTNPPPHTARQGAVPRNEHVVTERVRRCGGCTLGAEATGPRPPFPSRAPTGSYEYGHSG